MDDHAILYRKLEALTALYSTLELTAPLPPLGDWAIDPPFAVALVNIVLDCRPTVVVECGSGASTVITAATLRRHGIAGHVTSLESDAAFADVTRGYLRRHRLESYATVHTAPMSYGAVGHWYDTTALDQLAGDVGLLVVDGPSTVHGDHARAPALPALYERLAGDARILVDDALRPAEQAFLAQWSQDYPDIKFSWLLTQNGAAFGVRS